MLGRILDRRWIVLLISVCLIGTSKWCEAKQMPDPDLLMSETGLMLLVIDDVPGTMVKAKKFFDGVYKEYREQGVLGPLQTPMTQYIFQQAKGDQPTHWLIKAVDSIATEGTELEKVWRPIAEKLAKDPTQVTPEEEEEVIAAFARLFKGKMFIGEEDYNPYRTTIFGFEYDPEVFDWMKELRLVAERQRERYGYEDCVTTIGGVDVIHLPNEGWFVFSIENVIYGVVERELEKTKLYVSRIRCMENGRTLNWETLRSARRFQRGTSTPGASQGFSSDGQLYLDTENYFKRGTQRTTRLQQGSTEIKSSRFPEISWCSSCFFRFAIDESGRELRYCIEYPLLLPVEGPPKALVEEFEGVAVPESIRLSVSDVCLSIRLPNGGVLNRAITWDGHHYLLPQRLWFGLLKDDDNGFEENGREPDDLLEHFRRSLERMAPTIPIMIVSRKYEWNNYSLVANGMCIKADLIGSVVDFLQAVNDVPFDLKFVDLDAYGVPRLDRYQPDVIELADSKKLKVDAELQHSKTRFQVLERRHMKTVDVFFVGVKVVEFVIIEKNGYLNVYSCQAIPKDQLEQLILSVVNSTDRTIAAKPRLIDMVKSNETVLELLYHTEPEPRGRNIGLMPYIGNSGMNELQFDLRLTNGDDFSAIYFFYSVFASLARPENDSVEQLWNVSRSRPVDCFQAVTRRENSLVHVGCMMLPEE